MYEKKERLAEGILSSLVNTVYFTKVLMSAVEAVEKNDYEAAGKNLSKASILKEKIVKNLNDMRPGKGDEFAQQVNPQMDLLYDKLEDLKSSNC